MSSERLPGSGKPAVPLKTRCSRRCERPAADSSSWREPTPTHRAADTDRACDISWVTTRSPLSSTVRTYGSSSLGRRATERTVTLGVLVLVGAIRRIGRHHQLHLDEAQVACQLFCVARQGATATLLIGSQAWSGCRELEDDPFRADDQRVDQQLVGGGVELQIVEGIEVDADRERR